MCGLLWDVAKCYAAGARHSLVTPAQASVQTELKSTVLTLLLLFALTGCGKLFSIDGNWKLSYPICMYRVPKQISGFDGALKYVDSCPNQPAPWMAFCEHHCSVATTKGVPCPLREFLQHIGVNHDGNIILCF